MLSYSVGSDSFMDPMGWSPPGSSVHGLLQASMLEWAAVSFSRGPSQPRDGTQVSRVGRWVLYHCTTREARLKSRSGLQH